MLNLRQPLKGSPWPLLELPAYLGQDVRIGVVLQEHSRRPSVIIACSYVQCWQTHFALGPVVNQVSHHIFVTLLQSHSQRCESILPWIREGGRDT